MLGIEFRSSLPGRKIDRQMQIAGAKRADAGCQVHRQGANDNITRGDAVNIQVRHEQCAHRPGVLPGPGDGAGVARYEEAALAWRPRVLRVLASLRLDYHASIVSGRPPIVR